MLTDALLVTHFGGISVTIPVLACACVCVRALQQLLGNPAQNTTQTGYNTSNHQPFTALLITFHDGSGF